MRKLKKSLSLLLALAMFWSLATIPAQAKGSINENGMTVFCDDMQSHSITSEESSKDTNALAPGAPLVAGVWQVSDTFGGAGDCYYNVTYDRLYANNWCELEDSISTVPGTTENDVVLELQARGDKSGQHQAAVNLVKDLSSLGDNYEVSVDIRSYHRSAISNTMGIRLCNPAKETEYYEIALFGHESSYHVDTKSPYAPRFSKVIDAGNDTPDLTTEGSEGSEYKYVEYSPVGTHSGSYRTNTLTNHTNWYTVKIIRDGNKFSWSIIEYPLENDYEPNTVWESSWTDDSPLFDNMGTLQLFEYKDSKKYGKTYFDNVSIKQATGIRLFRGAPTTFERYSDDMEEYSISTPASKNAGDTVAGKWKVAPISGTNAAYGVEFENVTGDWWSSQEKTENTVLKLRPSVDFDNQAAINFDAEIGVEDGYKISIDLRNLFDGQNPEVMGIRLVDPNNEANYYEIALISDTAEIYNTAETFAPRFTKVVGGKEDSPMPREAGSPASEWAYVDYGEIPTNSGLYKDGGFQTDPFTLSIGISKKTVLWKVTNKEENATYWNDSYTDNDKLFTGEPIVQIFAYGGGDTGKTYNDMGVMVDNFKVDIEFAGLLNYAVSWRKDTTNAPWLLLAHYDENDRFVAVERIETTAGKEGYIESASPIEALASRVKLMLWEAGSMKPITNAAEAAVEKISSFMVTFPTYTKKAATFTLDGADIEKNRELINFMTSQNVPATVNFATNDTYDTVYAGDMIELANNGTELNMSMTESYNGANVPTKEECITAITSGAQNILTQSGKKAKGFAWNVSAPEERADYSDLQSRIKTDGYLYARNGHANMSIKLPADWMDWNYTAWVSSKSENLLFNSIDELNEALDIGDFVILSLSDEYSDYTAAQAIDAYTNIFNRIDNDVWMATSAEVVEYIEACSNLEVTTSRVYNPSKTVTVYLLVNGEEYIAPPESEAVRN